MPASNTCSNCDHWKRIASGGVRANEGPVGECHGGPPVADFKFPRTRAIDTCAQHSACAVSFATARPEPQDDVPEYEPGHRSATFRPELISPETRAKMDRDRARAQAEAAQEKSLFDVGAGSATSSGQPDRNGGPAAAVDAAAPQSTAATGSATSPSQARAHRADATARSVSRSGPRRKA